MKTVNSHLGTIIGSVVVVAAALVAAPVAFADVGAAIRVGTLGIGADVDFGINDHLGARIGYSAYNYSRTIDNTSVTYDGTIKLSNPSATLDWYPFAGGFRLSLGAVVSGTKVDAVGKPDSTGTYTLNGHQYSASDVGTLNGEFKFGNSVAPYVGLGWGNPAGAGSRLTFVFDLGAVYGGTPNIALTATCGASTPAPVCAQLQTDVMAEKASLQDKVTLIKWYPVVSLGFGYRF